MTTTTTTSSNNLTAATANERDSTNPSSASSNEKLCKLLKPNPTHDQILSALKHSFFQDDDLVQIKQELDSYDDRNYLIEAVVSNNGESSKSLFVLKVHNGVESRNLLSHIQENGNDYYAGLDSVIHWQNALVDHLQARGIPTPVPQHVVQWNSANHSSQHAPPVSFQQLPVVSAEHSPCDLALRLLSWLPGRPLSSIPMLPIESLADAGRFLGNMDQQLDQMDANQYRAAKRFHQWDTKHTLGLRNFTQSISNLHRRQLVESIIDTFQTQIIDSGVGSSFRVGINHADFNDANIIVDKDMKVCGVIDFGDSVER
jgi:hypothetical protein